MITMRGQDISISWGDAGGQRFILKDVLPELTWVDDITSVFHSTNTLLGKCINHCKAGYCIFYTIKKNWVKRVTTMKIYWQVNLVIRKNKHIKGKEERKGTR